MPRIRYVGPFDEVSVDGLGAVKNGESLDVADADLAKSLLEQADNWSAEKSPTTKNVKES